MRRVALIVLCVFLAGCGSHVSDKEALETYFKKAGPDPSILSNPGPIRSVGCRARGLTYRSAQVYVCDVNYERGDIGEVCGARIDGKIVTRGLPRGCVSF